MMKKELEYPFEIRPLAQDEGGGWLITYPDLPGCMSDGETPEEAIANGRDAVIAWLKAVEQLAMQDLTPSFSNAAPRLGPLSTGVSHEKTKGTHCTNIGL
jgi:predicted RNase H-like HicB family nuclease